MNAAGDDAMAFKTSAAKLPPPAPIQAFLLLPNHLPSAPVQSNAALLFKHTNTHFCPLSQTLYAFHQNIPAVISQNSKQEPSSQEAIASETKSFFMLIVIVLPLSTYYIIIIIDKKKKHFISCKSSAKLKWRRLPLNVKSTFSS